MSTHLSGLELACGLVLGGVDQRLPPLPAPAVAPLAALQAAVLPALRRPPCLVSFSGGRDSSAVLAVATTVARREGLADPIPATNRFRDAPASEEKEWQEQVIAHLRLNDWLRLEFTDELDAVGPYACRALRRHGLLWPFNAHFHLPVIEAAAEGALLTGAGGDELFMAASRPRAYAVLRGLARPRPRDALTLGLALAPRPLRRAVHARRTRVPFGWLRPQARRALARAIADEEAREPQAPARRLRCVPMLRALSAATGALATLASDHNVVIVHPLATAEVAAALARAFPIGFSGRTEGMRALFEAVLPRALLGRSTKACFDEAFFRRHSREFAEAWEGDGVPLRLVDPAALACEWQSPTPAPQSLTLIQSAWLERERRADCSGDDRVEHSVGGRLERVPATRPAQA